MTLHRISMLAAMAVLALVAVAPEAQAATIAITDCGQTVTTNAVLTRSLFCTGTGIVVGASGITIDLKGFVLRGNGGGYGIDDTGGWDAVTVKNGVVRTFFDGIDAGGANSITVSRVIASGNNRGVVISGASPRSFPCSSPGPAPRASW